MGNVIAYVATGLGWCFCTAMASLLTSCCGNDKLSTVPPSATSGRRRSVFLLLLSIGLAFAFQYGVAPALRPDGSAVANVPHAGQYLVDSWNDGCQDYQTKLSEICSGNAGVYRVASATFLFFILAAIGAMLKPTANREAWPAKYVLYLFLVAGTIFISNEALFYPVFMNLARIGGVASIIFQQLIILDLAYNLNESWVEKADKSDLEFGTGAGKKWLGALLFACGVFFVGSIVVIGLMFKHFSGCRSNTAFISVTLVVGLICIGIQMSGEEASLFTSCAIFAYATYLCLTAVSKNPNGECNPRLGKEDVLGIFLGISISILSLAWIGWSLTAHNRVGSESDVPSDNLVEGRKPDGVTGVVVGSRLDEETGGTSEELESGYGNRRTFSNSWKLNIILACLTCWYAMALTGWGAVQTGGNSANPNVSNVSMWMIISSQWLTFALYLWTLTAPRLFPDRDFS